MAGALRRIDERQLDLYDPRAPSAEWERWNGSVPVGQQAKI